VRRGIGKSVHSEDESLPLSRLAGPPRSVVRNEKALLHAYWELDVAGFGRWLDHRRHTDAHAASSSAQMSVTHYGVSLTRLASPSLPRERLVSRRRRSS